MNEGGDLTQGRTGIFMTATKQSGCRFCGTKLDHTFVDLGMSPLCESFLPGDQLNQMEAFYPLHAYVCGNCFLVQLEAYVTPEHIFSDYAYFSSYSDSWLAHAKKYTDRMAERFGIGEKSFGWKLPGTTEIWFTKFPRSVWRERGL